MATRYAAGAAGLPFGILRGYIGTDLPKHTSTIKTVECPFTGEVLAAVPAINPDVGIIHAQQADRDGNVQIWGLARCAERSGAGRHAIDRDGRGDRRRACPRCRVPSCCRRGWSPRCATFPAVRTRASPWASPSATTSSTRHGTPISKDRDAFTAWIDKHVMGTADFAEYCGSVGI